jgi:hypothetical protein
MAEALECCKPEEVPTHQKLWDFRGYFPSLGPGTMRLKGRVVWRDGTGDFWRNKSWMDRFASPRKLLDMFAELWCTGAFCPFRAEFVGLL